MTRTTVAAALGAAAFFLVACGGGPSAPPDDGAPTLPSARQGVVDVTVEQRGGMCAAPDGTGTTCSRSVTVTSDGAVTVADATMASPEPADEVDTAVAVALATIIENGFDDLTAAKFDGTCPTTMDGTERVITVRRLPGGEDAVMADAAVITVASCQHDLTTPAARDVLDAFDEVWQGARLPQI